MQRCGRLLRHRRGRDSLPRLRVRRGHPLRRRLLRLLRRRRLQVHLLLSQKDRPLRDALLQHALLLSERG